VGVIHLDFEIPPLILREQLRNAEKFGGKEEMEKLRNKDQTQSILHISRATLDRHIAKGLIVPTKIGRLVFFREVEIERFIRSCEAKVRRKARVKDVA
jgi:predicted DNA-binding transcriptional regulator AlpA